MVRPAVLPLGLCTWISLLEMRFLFGWGTFCVSVCVYVGILVRSIRECCVWVTLCVRISVCVYVRVFIKHENAEKVAADRPLHIQ